MAITPAKLGLTYRLADCLRLHELIGPARSREMLLLAREIDAQTAMAWGMVTEITNVLSRFKSLFVIASASTLSFKGKAVSPQEVGRLLGVRYLLDGSVRKAGNRIRIAVQLIDAADGAQAWSERFDDTLEDVFDLQDKVALAVAGAIEPSVLAVEIRRAAERPTVNMSSYDLYLRAFPLERTHELAQVREALTLLERAIELDPTNGLALGLAAHCYYIIDFLYGWDENPEANRRRGVDVARRAIIAAADDASVLTYAALAILQIERDPAAAVAILDRAVALNPGNALPLHVNGFVRLRAGCPDIDLSIARIEMAMRLDPLGSDHVIHATCLGLGRLLQRRFEEAVALFKEWSTHNPFTDAFLASCYGHLGQTEPALESMKRYRAVSASPIDVFARVIFFDPAHVRLFLDGIALAEGKSAADAQDTH